MNWITEIDFARRMAYSLARGLHGQTGKKVREMLVRDAFASFGFGAAISEYVRILRPSGISLGEKSRVNRGCLIDGRGGLKIGAEALIGFDTVVLTKTHDSSDVGAYVSRQGSISAQVTIDEGVWVGCRVIILPGVSIGAGAVIGAGSVVTKDILPLQRVAGVPARPI